MTRVLRVALVIALASAAVMSGARVPAFGQDTSAVFDMNEPWPRLPDGRLVFTFYGVRLAVPTCEHCLNSFKFGNKGTDPLKMREAIANSRRLREIAHVATHMTLTMGNSWDPEVSNEPFLGQFDRRSLPQTARIELTVFADETAPGCWLRLGNYRCQIPHAIASQAHPPGPDGFYTLSGPIIIPRRTAQPIQDSFILGYGERLFIAPLDQVHDANGLPLQIYCFPLNGCDNSGHNGPPDFALRSNVDVYFQFQESRYQKSELKAMHARVIEAMESLLLDKPVSEQKP